jgi:hypothetical protein
MGCGLVWLNEQGFGGEWGDRIAAELAERGIHADFREARFSPLQGIIVKGATIYHGDDRSRVFARIPELHIDIDRARAFRGELVLRKLVLQDTDMTIPFATGTGKPAIAEFSKLSGEVTIDRQGRLLLQNAHGLLAGMEFDLHAELDHFELGSIAGEARQADDQSRSEFLQQILAELSRWSFPQSTPPKLDLRLAGNLSKPGTIRTAFTLEAEELSRQDYTMKDVVLSGNLLGRHLSVKRVFFSDGAGELEADADYGLRAREGRYTLSSSIHLARLLRTCFDHHGLDQMVSSQTPKIDAYGDFRIAPDGSFSAGAAGTVDLPRFRFLGSSFERLQSEFSWKEDSTFLRNLRVTHRDGELTGQVHIQGDTIKYRAKSTLPLSVLSPFVAETSGLARIIGNCEFGPKSTVLLETELGTIARSNLKEWHSRGRARFTNLSYRGVPFHSLSADYSISPIEHIYSKIEGRFDYSRHGPSRRHGTVSSALVRADRISHDRGARLTRIKNLRGTAWPGPVLRLFAPKAADHVENSYRFRKPPTFVSNGVVGHKGAAALTDVKTSLKTHASTDYTFLKRELTLEKLTGQVRYRHRRVDATGLTFRVFNGPVGGNVTVRLKPGARSSYSGGLHWTRVRLAAIGKTFGFAKADQGYVTGRFDFSGVSGNIRTLDGTGALGLERGHLFYVPVLGPLSTILGGILGDKRASHEEARDASCTFAVRDGIFYTKDFHTSTPSTVFTGEGAIDLDRDTIDMTVRMNARGFLGLITLPLRPFNGLFQFSGKGPLSKPVWRSAPFESPPSGKNDPLFRKPSRALIVPER